MEERKQMNVGRKIIDQILKMAIVSLQLLFCFYAYQSVFAISIPAYRITILLIINVFMAYIVVFYFHKIWRWGLIVGGSVGVLIFVNVIRRPQQWLRLVEKAVQPVIQSYEKCYAQYMGFSEDINPAEIHVQKEFMVVVMIVFFVYALLFFLIAKKGKGFFVVVLMMSAPMISAATVGVLPNTMLCIGMLFSCALYRICYRRWETCVMLKEILIVVIGFSCLTISAQIARPYLEKQRDSHQKQFKQLEQKVLEFDFAQLKSIVGQEDQKDSKNKNVILNGNLNVSEGRRETGQEMLRVTLTRKPSTTFYLKNFIGVTYEKNQWKEMGTPQLRGNENGRTLIFDEENRKIITEEAFRRIHLGNGGVPLCEATIEVLAKSKNKSFIPYYGRTVYTTNVTIAESIIFTDEKEEQIQLYDCYLPQDVMDLELRDLYQQTESAYLWKQYKEEIVKKIDTEIPESANEIRSYVEHMDVITADDVAREIDALFAQGFKYSLQPGNLQENKDAVIGFLEQKSGFCIHFASASALMYRACGIPSRYVEGFAIPPEVFQKNDNDTYTAVVTDKMAHAWCETLNDKFCWEIREHTIADDKNQNTNSTRNRQQFEKETVKQETKRVPQTEKPQEITTIEEQQQKQEKKTEIEKTEKKEEKETNIEEKERLGSTVISLIKIGLVLALVYLCIRMLVNIRTKMYHRKCNQMKQKGKDGVLFAYSEVFRICKFKKQKYRGENEKEIFYEMMFAFPKLSQEEWEWMYDKAVEARFSEKRIEKDEVDRMIVLYKKFRREILKDMQGKNQKKQRILFWFKGL